MKGFLEKIAAADFRKPVKRLILITLAVVLVCGALNAYMAGAGPGISQKAIKKAVKSSISRLLPVGLGGPNKNLWCFAGGIILTVKVN